MAMDKTAALSRIASFAGLPQPLLDKLADLSGIQRISKGSTLFCEGERAHFIYALVEGSVSLLNGPKREETIAEFMEAGDIILIPPALLGLPYMVTARAVTDLLVVMMPAEDFLHLAETELALSTALNRLLAGHWRLLLRHLTQTKSRDADTRLIQYLIDSAGAAKGFAQFNLPGSKRDLAAHLGITPETLSRSLKRLGRLGVKTVGSEIQIEEVSRLSALFRHSSHAVPYPTPAPVGVPQ
jgi:CRP/FNR family transcriptional activator FtrB